MENKYKDEPFEGNPNPSITLTREQFDRWNDQGHFMSLEDAINKTRSFVKLPKKIALNDYVNTNLSELIFEHYRYVKINNDDSIVFITENGTVDNDSITVNGAYKIAKEISFHA